MNTKSITIIALFLIIGVITYTSMKTNKNLVGADDNVIHVEKDDPEMNAAIALAKTEYPNFVKNWKTIKNDGYSLKFGIPTDDGDIEHIWFNPIEIQDDVITAKCANVPEKVSKLKEGDIRKLNQDQISDWMIVIGNKCYGGYTIKVLVQRDPSQKSPFEFAEFK